MHTLTMAQSILQAALSEARKHEGKRIKAISARIDNEAFADADSVQFCLEAEAEGTPAEGARIEIELGCSKEPPQVTLDLD